MLVRMLTAENDDNSHKDNDYDVEYKTHNVKLYAIHEKCNIPHTTVLLSSLAFQSIYLLSFQKWLNRKNGILVRTRIEKC